MNLEFNIYGLKKESESYTYLNNILDDLGDAEFIVVGEEGEFFKVLQIKDSGIPTFADVPIDMMALQIKKSDMKFYGDGIGIESAEFDIPKKNLNMDLIENILRLNEL